MNDRGIKKWQPFNSLGNTLKIKQELNKQKIKTSMPLLSEDQLEKIENNIKEAYYNKDLIIIHYYLNGNIIKKQTKIKNINYNSKKIILSDNTILYYKQIIKVKNN